MPDILEFLKTRRSVKISKLAEPGPTPAQIETMLQIASRVPDHGKYAPWYFIVFSGEARTQAGEKLAELFQQNTPEATPAQIEHERARFLRAPVVIAVVSRIREGKNAQWEQILSAGAACYNLSLAAHALGFGVNWVTEWYSYNESFKEHLGIAAPDHIAGFIYIGTATEKPEDRERPDLTRLVTNWSPGIPLNTGEGYGHPGAGLPEKGF